MTTRKLTNQISEHPNPSKSIECNIEYKSDCGYSCQCKKGYKETEAGADIKAEFEIM